MRLRQIAEALQLTELTGPIADNEATEITAGYASDLLSDVLAHAPAGGVLVTLQVHLNVIAVASHAGLRAVIFSSGRKPEDDVIQRAVDEQLTLYGSTRDTFELVGLLYELGVKGQAE
jgi:hypothetical protein